MVSRDQTASLVLLQLPDTVQSCSRGSETMNDQGKAMSAVQHTYCEYLHTKVQPFHVKDDRTRLWRRLPADVRKPDRLQTVQPPFDYRLVTGVRLYSSQRSYIRCARQLEDSL